VKLLLVAAVALAAAVPAAACNSHPTEAGMEARLVCPTCHTPLDESSSPVAQQMKVFIRQRIAQGASDCQIVKELVGPPNNLGSGVLGVPATHGFDLLAWVLPLGGIGLGAIALGAGAWAWSRNRPGSRVSLASGLTPEDELRVDQELARFDG
jgi:cytochrome c-type biogenesis protein CcmH/NrfF